MAMDQPLNGIGVLVTRPQAQAKALAEKLSVLGANVVLLPVIEVVPIAPTSWPDVDISALDMLIFVSRNAVTSFMAGFDGAILANKQCVAVGAATAQFMIEHGLSVDIQAPPPAGSESLLAMSAMQNMADKQVLIVRGETGRELLAETLVARGATIHYLEVYRRCLPAYDDKRITEAMQADWVLVTSVAGLENLCQIVNNDAIKLKMLLVVSTRIEQVAKELGFQHVVVTNDVNDDAVINRIVEIGQKNG
jgi:uroporphyrinogen-III synthase